MFLPSGSSGNAARSAQTNLKKTKKASRTVHHKGSKMKNVKSVTVGSFYMGGCL